MKQNAVKTKKSDNTKRITSSLYHYKIVEKSVKSFVIEVFNGESWIQMAKTNSYKKALKICGLA